MGRRTALMPKPRKIMPKTLVAMERAVDWEIGAILWIVLRADYGQLMLSYQQGLVYLYSDCLEGEFSGTSNEDGKALALEESTNV